MLEGVDDRILVDIDDAIIEVHGHGKQGAGFGYTGKRGLNALTATIATAQAAPMIAAQRLRKGSCGSPRGAARMVADTLATVRRLRQSEGPLGPSLGPCGFGVLRALHHLGSHQGRSGSLGHGPTGSQGAGRYRSDT